MNSRAPLTSLPITKGVQLPESKLRQPQVYYKRLRTNVENVCEENEPMKKVPKLMPTQNPVKTKPEQKIQQRGWRVDQKSTARLASARTSTSSRMGTMRPVKKSVPAPQKRRTASVVPETKVKPTVEETKGSMCDIPKPKKRPAWDVKGRLQDMIEINKSLKQKLGDSAEKEKVLEEYMKQKEELDAAIQNLQNDKVHVETTLSEERFAAQKEMENIQISHSKQMEQLRGESQFQFSHMQEAHQQLDNLQKQTEAALRQSEMANTEHYNKNVALESTVSRLHSQLQQTGSELTTLRIQYDNSCRECEMRGQNIAQLTARLEERERTIADLEMKRQEDVNLRKKLHNTIQELKGNVRVFARVRPFLSNEGNSGKENFIFEEGADSKEMQVIGKERTSANGEKCESRKYFFSFDKIFHPTSSQENVFEEISQLVQSALDGYHVCIFAYGQTGSGKTFTMEGSEKGIEDEQFRGMIPRSVEQIFSVAEAMGERGWTYQLGASYLEIYNEQLRDLLDSDNEKKMDIKHDRSGKTSVTNLRILDVTTPMEVIDLLVLASKHRATHATKCNDRSSRSHSLFQLRIAGRNSNSDETVEGLLNLIDLAGSERLAQSGSEGDRLKEAQFINKSLSSLGDVITALANKERHVPYRNTKLTYLLQNSLGGEAKTLMFANVSPSEGSLGETVSTLRFASKVNSCQIGTAGRTVHFS